MRNAECGIERIRNGEIGRLGDRETTSEKGWALPPKKLRPSRVGTAHQDLQDPGWTVGAGLAPARVSTFPNRNHNEQKKKDREIRKWGDKLY